MARDSMAAKSRSRFSDKSIDHTIRRTLKQQKHMNVYNFEKKSSSLRFSYAALHAKYITFCCFFFFSTNSPFIFAFSCLVEGIFDFFFVYQSMLFLLFVLVSTVDRNF